MDTLPDTQNKGAEAITGAPVAIREVGSANFRMPLRIHTGASEPQLLETRVSGTVSLSADRKGINMSRIMRGIYGFEQMVFSPESLGEVLAALQQEIQTRRLRLKLNFNCFFKQNSLRSGLQGWQLYPAAFEAVLEDGRPLRRIVHFDFIYSSACPASFELSEHARAERGLHPVPHSQRSKARLRVVPPEGVPAPTLAELQNLCAHALQTETQVMVRRTDEQAFAELNGAHLKFVEDAVRLLYAALDDQPHIEDFLIACAHLESLHSHDAVAILPKGRSGGFTGDEFPDFLDLLC
jgi:GTP cyclohydrolase IB